MFKTLTSKLNGGNPPKEIATTSLALSNSNSSKPGQGKTDAQAGSIAPRPAGHEKHLSAISGPGGQVASRPTNPFAKGVSGLHNEHNSYRHLSANQQTWTKPTNTSASTGGSHQHKSSGSRKEQQTSPTRVKTPVTAASTEAADGDLSFGADDFLIGSDELALADLMDDLDGDKDKDKDKDNEESLSLSWTPTPPKSSGEKQQGATNNIFKLDPRSAVAHGWLKVNSAPPSQASAVAPQQTTRTFVRSTPSKPNTIASESSDRGITMVPNSQEDSSTRPNERDTIDHRSAQRAHDMKEQDRKGLLRTQSSPSTGFASKTSPIRNRRKLPGPAGNLPRLSAEEKEELFRSRGVPFGKDTRITGTNSTSPNSSIKKKMKAVAHGPVDSMFANGAWEEMRKAYGLPDYKPSTISRCKGTSPMIELCLSDVENRQDLHRGKIPGLVVMIKEVSLSEIDAAVTLLDPSGEMRGTVHRTVLEQYKNNEIRVGTVLALKNVSVFSPTPSSHYLIITLRNIIGIFLPHPPTIILSQGSSQERNSQKKRKQVTPDTDSLESGSLRGNPFAVALDSSAVESSAGPSGTRVASHKQVSSSSSQTSDELAVHTAVGKRRREFSPQKNEASAPKEAAVFSQHDTNGKKQSQGRSSYNTPSQQQQSQDDLQEIQFQSLRQTLGASSTTSMSNRQSGSFNDFSSTPMISLGGATPNINANTPSKPSNSKQLLSSFAASASLRKRSSPTRLTSQNSSAADSGARPNCGASSVSSSHAFRHSSALPEIEAARSSSSATSPTLPERPMDALNSYDWPDDFAEVDFEVSLEEGHPNLPGRGQNDAPGSANTNPSTVQASALRQRQNHMMVGDDDEDLENLLDGLDENELFDLDS
ncbi:hypothetical protein BGZ75_006323 [Mortierella antarctica]|nr:hypothetical protein BGZ75_006323 [Mortierella antarctica]